VPQKELHKNQDSPSTEVAIRSNLIEDLYVILASVTDDGKANIKVQINPLVSWLWIGGVVMLVGGLITFWPDAREARSAVPRASLRPLRELEASNV
jgi:cytochrome c-type biogenesis protein CcmF